MGAPALTKVLPHRPTAAGDQLNEDELARAIEAAKTQKLYRPLLLELLAEDHPAFRGKSANAVVRLRGYALAAMEIAGTPPDAFPYILNILENERNAYLIGGACKALRGSRNPRQVAIPSLLTAFDHIRLKDDALSYTTYKPRWPLTDYTTALKEILATLRWYRQATASELNSLNQLLGDNEAILLSAILEDLRQTIQTLQGSPAQTCCTVPAANIRNSYQKTKHLIATAEDQERKTFQLENHLQGHITVLSFFYTRCDNPFKCSLTVSNLAQLSRECPEKFPGAPIQIIGITYDAAHDTAEKLKNYGEQRGFAFSAGNRLIRVPKDFDAVKAHFRNGVSFIGSIVNQHRIEVYLTNANGEIFQTFTRKQWQPAEVMHAIGQELSRQNAKSGKLSEAFQWGKNLLRTIGAGLFPFLVAFFPKCPLCWAVYMSALGISGSPLLSYNRNWLAVFIGMIAINYAVLIYRASRSRHYAPILLNTLGLFFSLFLCAYLKYEWAIYPGLALMLTGSSLSNTGFHLKRRLT